MRRSPTPSKRIRHATAFSRFVVSTRAPCGSAWSVTSLGLGNTGAEVWTDFPDWTEHLALAMSVTREMNALFADEKLEKGGHYGIILFDFASAELARQVVESNA